MFLASFSGRSLEYEKALPRKGKVFQMKRLPQPNMGLIRGLAEAADLLECINLAESSKSGIGWERLEQAGFGTESQ